MADAQVTLCWIVLANLVANVLSFALPLGPFSGILLIFIALAAFTSYRALFGLPWAIVLTLLTFIPIVGFVVVSGEDRDALRAALAPEITPVAERDTEMSVLDAPDA